MVSEDRITHEKVQAFAAELRSRLAACGVSAEDLRPVIVSIYQTRGREAYDLLWEWRSEYDENYDITLMGSVLRQDETWNTYKARDAKGRIGQRTLYYLTQAEDDDEILGVWAMAALVPLYASSRISSEEQQRLYNPTGGEKERNRFSDAIELSPMLAGFGATPFSQLWTNFNTFELSSHHSASTPRTSGEREAPTEIVEMIAWSISETLRDNVPMLRKWSVSDPATNDRLRAGLAIAREADERERDKREDQRQRDLQRKEELKKMSPLERRYELLPYHQKDEGRLNSRRMEETSDDELLDLYSKIPLEPLSLSFGMSSNAFLKAVRYVHYRMRGVDEAQEEKHLKRACARYNGVGPQTLSCAALALHSGYTGSLTHLARTIPVSHLAVIFRRSIGEINQMLHEAEAA